MQKDSQQYQCYVDILKEELVPAMGCTEPIALAYAAAKARTVLGALPDRVLLQVSGSIIKCEKRDCPQHRSPQGHQCRRSGGHCGWRGG